MGERVEALRAHSGYGNRSDNDNNERERIWFSPHCLRVDGVEAGSLFAPGEEAMKP